MELFDLLWLAFLALALFSWGRRGARGSRRRAGRRARGPEAPYRPARGLWTPEDRSEAGTAGPRADARSASEAARESEREPERPSGAERERTARRVGAGATGAARAGTGGVGAGAAGARAPAAREHREGAGLDFSWGLDRTRDRPRRRAGPGSRHPLARFVVWRDVLGPPRALRPWRPDRHRY